MQITAAISRKGGSGKSTLSVHLACAATLAGKKVALIDLDPQCSAARWSDRREAELPMVISCQAARLGKEIERLRSLGCEYLVIDTAPHSDSAALDAARAADIVLVPCRPAIFDVEAVISTTGLVDVTGTRSFVVLNAVPSYGTAADAATELLTSMGVNVATERLGNRVAFARALISGRTAQEIEPEGRAAEEAKNLFMFACGHVPMSNSVR